MVVKVDEKVREEVERQGGEIPRGKFENYLKKAV
jgi:hypothetical protein